ncbi:hypothetical protein AVEN_73046-1 [Araneus ventricosus]|uniref:Uncharacterized protein n=1 Tax=Araneus ventricosus TaxID=182803 RepID=A0A4Y2FCL2_ARAVE|nr:hypothetical protein AVEN_73046-1 [Araneus ventricosus]
MIGDFKSKSNHLFISVESVTIVVGNTVEPPIESLIIMMNSRWSPLVGGTQKSVRNENSAARQAVVIATGYVREEPLGNPTEVGFYFILGASLRR